MGEFPQNVGPWLCYFNTRTEAFEQTDRLPAEACGNRMLEVNALE